MCRWERRSTSFSIACRWDASLADSDEVDPIWHMQHTVASLLGTMCSPVLLLELRNLVLNKRSNKLRTLSIKDAPMSGDDAAAGLDSLCMRYRSRVKSLVTSQLPPIMREAELVKIAREVAAVSTPQEHKYVKVCAQQVTRTFSEWS
jgi:hypothetical protein